MVDTNTNHFSTIRVRMSTALKGFESGLPQSCDRWKLRGSRPDPKFFPVPELVLLALRDVMGFSWSSQGEKVRWSVYATVEGEPFVFEQRKFGFAIDHRDGIEASFLGRVTCQLSSSLKFLEPALQDLAKEQIDEGNFTLKNRHAEFDNRYRYFREMADTAFGTAPDAPVDISPWAGIPKDIDVFAGLSGQLNRALAHAQTGYFASGAMVDAYFSKLEHRVLLLRAFIGRPLATGDFKTFLNRSWDARWREVANFDADPASGRLLGRLRDVKATIRNPLAHGGVENDGGAFYFHMPGIGAIPANLSRYQGRLRTSFFPISDTTHTQICALFDEVDTLLGQGPLELPNEFVQAGVDPQFDSKSIKRYAKALAGGAEAVEALVDRLSHEWERHVNYEY
jgi:hypothetical protein